MAWRLRLNRTRVLISRRFDARRIGRCVWGIFRRRSDGLAGNRSRRTRGAPAGGRSQRHVQSVRPTRLSRSHRSQSADRGAISHVVSGRPARLVGEGTPGMVGSCKRSRRSPGVYQKLQIFGLPRRSCSRWPVTISVGSPRPMPRQTERVDHPPQLMYARQGYLPSPWRPLHAADDLGSEREPWAAPGQEAPGSVAWLRRVHLSAWFTRGLVEEVQFLRSSDRVETYGTPSHLSCTTQYSARTAGVSAEPAP
jgi:hypothetical protein